MMYKSMRMYRDIVHDEIDIFTNKPGHRHTVLLSLKELLVFNILNLIEVLCFLAADTDGNVENILEYLRLSISLGRRKE